MCATAQGECGGSRKISEDVLPRHAISAATVGWYQQKILPRGFGSNVGTTFVPSFPVGTTAQPSVGVPIIKNTRKRQIGFRPLTGTPL